MPVIRDDGRPVHSRYIRRVLIDKEFSQLMLYLRHMRSMPLAAASKEESPSNSKGNSSGPACWLDDAFGTSIAGSLPYVPSCCCIASAVEVLAEGAVSAISRSIPSAGLLHARSQHAAWSNTVLAYPSLASRVNIASPPHS